MVSLVVHGIFRACLLLPEPIYLRRSVKHGATVCLLDLHQFSCRKERSTTLLHSHTGRHDPCLFLLPQSVQSRIKVSIEPLYGLRHDLVAHWLLGLHRCGYVGLKILRGSLKTAALSLNFIRLQFWVF